VGFPAVLFFPDFQRACQPGFSFRAISIYHRIDYQLPIAGQLQVKPTAFVGFIQVHKPLIYLGIG
jgi:hypothetical protein